MKMLLPFVLLIAGLGAGVGAGVLLGPAGTSDDDAETSDSHDSTSKQVARSETPKHDPGHGTKSDSSGDFEYLKLTKQFVVPVVKENEISALVTLSLSLETHPGISEAFYAIEPKLRDGFLQVLFDHANIGGFDGEFTSSGNLEILRNSLLDVARKDLGEDVSRVLIMSVSRQDT